MRAEPSWGGWVRGGVESWRWGWNFAVRLILCGEVETWRWGWDLMVRLVLCDEAEPSTCTVCRAAESEAVLTPSRSIGNWKSRGKLSKLWGKSHVQKAVAGVDLRLKGGEKPDFEAVESCGRIVANFWRWSEGNHMVDAFAVGRNDALLVVCWQRKGVPLCLGFLPKCPQKVTILRKCPVKIKTYQNTLQLKLKPAAPMSSHMSSHHQLYWSYW
jgi:hypothetical protein